MGMLPPLGAAVLGAMVPALAALPEGGRAAAEHFTPALGLSAPAYASDRSRSRRFPICWSLTNGGGGPVQYTLEVRRNTNVATRWRLLVAGTARTCASFRGRRGLTYLFRVRARDPLGNLSGYAYAETVVPLDERSRRVVFGPGWRRILRKRAYGRTLTRASARGREAQVRFRGSSVALIARRSPRGARLSIALGRRRRVVSLRGPDRFRRVVFRSRQLRPARHVLRVVTLDDGIADLDAVGVDTGPAPPPL